MELVRGRGLGDLGEGGRGRVAETSHRRHALTRIGKSFDTCHCITVSGDDSGHRLGTRLPGSQQGTVGPGPHIHGHVSGLRHSGHVGHVALSGGEGEAEGRVLQTRVSVPPALPPLDPGGAARPALPGRLHHPPHPGGHAPPTRPLAPPAGCPGRPGPQLTVLATPDGAESLMRGRGLVSAPLTRGHLARPAREEDAGHVAALQPPAAGRSLLSRGRVMMERLASAPVSDTPVGLW